MTIAERISVLFQSNPRIQLTDEQIASIPQIGAARHQHVNTICRQLFKEGRLVRRKASANIKNMSPRTWHSIVPKAPPLVFPEVCPQPIWWDKLREAILSLILAGGHFSRLVFRGNGNVHPTEIFSNWAKNMGMPTEVMPSDQFDAQYGYNPLPETSIENVDLSQITAAD